MPTPTVSLLNGASIVTSLVFFTSAVEKPLRTVRVRPSRPRAVAWTVYSVPGFSVHRDRHRVLSAFRSPSTAPALVATVTFSIVPCRASTAMGLSGRSFPPPSGDTASFTSSLPCGPAPPEHAAAPAPTSTPPTTSAAVRRPRSPGLEPLTRMWTPRSSHWAICRFQPGRWKGAQYVRKGRYPLESGHRPLMGFFY
ncbi:hypothetical protein GCM10023178_50870 [Actinomadura luteofluorescens]